MAGSAVVHYAGTDRPENGQALRVGESEKKLSESVHGVYKVHGVYRLYAHRSTHRVWHSFSPYIARCCCSWWPHLSDHGSTPSVCYTAPESVSSPPSDLSSSWQPSPSKVKLSWPSHQIARGNEFSLEESNVIGISSARNFQFPKQSQTPFHFRRYNLIASHIGLILLCSDSLS